MKLSSDRSLGRIRHPELTAKLMEICRGYPRSRIDLLGGQGKVQWEGVSRTSYGVYMKLGAVSSLQLEETCDAQGVRLCFTKSHIFKVES